LEPAGKDAFNNANNKILSATSQVRKGLKEVRSTAKALSKDIEINHYEECLRLIKNTISHAAVDIKCDIDNFENEEEVTKKCIYRTLQEGLTNGIRHGGARIFVFKLKYAENSLKFSLEDNGCGTSSIQNGFGLKAMEERVKEARGKLRIESELDEGFNIYINFSRK
jgi:signal transduction histidine kinase